MCRYWDVALLICFSVMFVGVKTLDHLPPPKNLNFIWVTPFTLNVTWEKPDDLDPTCNMNYTVEVHNDQVCHSKIQKKRTHHLNCTFYLSNENGLCITVTTIPVNCGNKHSSLPSNFIIPAPPVTLVRNLSCLYYSINNMTCTWNTDDDVQGLHFYYWLTNESEIYKCSHINDKMSIKGCDISSEYLKEYANDLFLMFNGTYKNISVNNTFKRTPPGENVKLTKPQLHIRRDQQKLKFETIRSGFEQFAEDCFEYIYTYTMCDHEKKIQGLVNHSLEYDQDCKYKASVKIAIKEYCGKGESESSDVVEYGENHDPNVPVLLAVIIISLIVSCCLIGCLVLIHRHKDTILPKIPEPSLLFKDILYNNIRMTEDSRSPPVGPLYVPIEETVSKLSLEPETLFLNKVQ